MPRNKKITERVFADIAETRVRKAAYEKFLKIDDDLGLQVSEFQSAMKDHYRELMSKCEDYIQSLAILEEIIIQIRCTDSIVMDKELRLSINKTGGRDYIYARTTFYRRDKEINDIRVLVGKAEEYGNNINELINIPEFRDLAILLLQKAMNKEIESNINSLKSISNYEKV